MKLFTSRVSASSLIEAGQARFVAETRRAMSDPSAFALSAPPARSSSAAPLPLVAAARDRLLAELAKPRPSAGRLAELRDELRIVQAQAAYIQAWKARGRPVLPAAARW